ncbi:MAG: CD0415/CD1112 family protein [Oscillospiraceae bacterium]|nr:CD0415/CD1112 family protein [Oscillospiraceae bacterium]
MDKIIERLFEAIHEFLVEVVGGIFVGIFDDVNERVGSIAADVAQTPQEWNANVWDIVRTLSDTVIMPIAGLIISYILCYELITAVTEKNNMNDIGVGTFLKYILKACVAVFLLSHVFEITMAIFDVSRWLAEQSAVVITGETSVDVTSIFLGFSDQLEAMGIGELFLLMIEALVVSLIVKIIAVLVTVVLLGRMIEIFLYCSVAPIPFATFANKEWGTIGNNYVKSLLALAFQAFFIMVILGIYSALIQSVVSADNIHALLLKIGAISVVLCLTLFKTSSISRSIFNAH